MPILPKQQPPYYTTSQDPQGYKEITLTDAQIKALPTTPIQIIPAPGPNKGILITSASASLYGTAIDYANISADSYAGFYYETSFYRATTRLREANAGNMSNFFQYTEPITVTFMAPYGVDLNPNPDEVVVNNGNLVHSGMNNLAIIFYVYNVAGNFTMGNSANTLTIRVNYTTINL